MVYFRLSYSYWTFPLDTWFGASLYIVSSGPKKKAVIKEEENPRNLQLTPEQQASLDETITKAFKNYGYRNVLDSVFRLIGFSVTTIKKSKLILIMP